MTLKSLCNELINEVEKDFYPSPEGVAKLCAAALIMYEALKAKATCPVCTTTEGCDHYSINSSVCRLALIAVDKLLEGGE